MASADIYADGLRRDERLERLKLFGLSSPAILLVLVILVIPVGWLFFVSFIGADGQFSMENYERMITRKSYFRIFITTFKISLFATALCILIGYPLAYFMSQLPNHSPDRVFAAAPATHRCAPKAMSRTAAYD